jgi:hypothetical protein
MSGDTAACEATLECSLRPSWLAPDCLPYPRSHASRKSLSFTIYAIVVSGLLLLISSALSVQLVVWFGALIALESLSASQCDFIVQAPFAMIVTVEL